MFESTGQHWCSFCEEELSKHQGIYAKVYHRWIEEEKAETINVICPSCQKKDKAIDEALTELRKHAREVEVDRGRVCAICSKAIKRKDKGVRVEFREAGKELRVDVCGKCLKENPELRLKAKKANPVFNVKVNCISADVCENFKKPGKDRGINCSHVVANMDGELYCRKAHPGHVRIYRERYAIPPSRRQLTKMITKLLPLYEKYGSPLLAEETSATSIPILPDTVEYELKEFPIMGNRVSLPWNAHVIKVIGDQTLAVLVAVEKKEEEK